jgi:hypothetical protein
MQEVIFDVTVEAVERLEKDENAKIDKALVLNGLFTYTVRKIRAHTAYDAIRKQPVEVGDSYMYVFTPSRRNFAYMIKNKLKNLRAEE